MSSGHHVVAKRCLCTVDPRYVGRLSRAWVRWLGDQRGALTLDERRAIETPRWSADAGDTVNA